MQKKIKFKTIEDIAIQYIINTNQKGNEFENTMNTIQDPKISIKGITTIGGSFYCHSNKFYENGNNYIFFRKIPPKTLSEDELITFNTETEESSSKTTIYNSNTVIKITHTKIFVKNCKNLKYSKKLYFPLKYDLVYDCLSELYLPLITNLDDLNNLKNYVIDTKKKIEYFVNHESIYEKNTNLIENFLNSQIMKKIDEFLEEEKCCEIIEFTLILFILHLMFGAKIQYTECINDEDMEAIYGEICFVLHKMLENIMLKLLFNENYNANNNNMNNNINNKKNQSNSISFESVCSRYVKDYFKGVEKSQNKIIYDLNTNMGIIFQRLYNAINILIINFMKAKITTNNIDNPDEIEKYFLSILDYQKSDNNEILINENEDDDINNENNNNNNNNINNDINNYNINNDNNNINNDNNNNRINEKVKLEKEFYDQLECFKMMFCFLTQKELKDIKDINSINSSTNNIINNNKIININEEEIDTNKNNVLDYKTKTPCKNETFTNFNEIVDPIWDNDTNPPNTTPNRKNVGNNNNNSKTMKSYYLNSVKGSKTNNNTPQIISARTTDNNASPSFYQQLKYYFNLYYSNFLQLLEKNKVKPPFLPEMDTKKYKYTLVLDLDETLVHYIEEENSAYVQVRPYADYFLKELSKHFEIVLFTAAEEDYTDIVLKELNKNKYITHILCRKYTELNNGSYIKDLSKLGRDLSKVCIVDNNKDNFSLQPENGLFISSYFGEQNDNELYLLCQDLMKIIEIQPDDIRVVIKQIDIAMQNRYADNMYVLQ